MEDFGYLKEEKNRFSGLLRKITLIGATVFSMICFIYITVSAYNFVSEDENGPVETIKSPINPIKVTVKNRIKNDARETNSSIYDDIFGNKQESLAQIIPKVYLAPEPVKPPKKAKIVIKHSKKSNADKKKSSNKPKDQRIVVYTDTKKESKGSKDLLTKGKIEEKKHKTTKKASTRGRVKVQIAALTSKESVGKYWRKLNKVSPKLFTGLKLFTKKVDLGKRGIFYRVQIGNFSDQIDAEKFCDKYVSQTKKSRADCIVVE